MIEVACIISGTKEGSEGGEGGAPATKTRHIFGYLPTNCQQTTNQRLAEKGMLFVMTALTWGEC